MTISALMHNMTWLQMLTMRQAVLFTGQEDAKAAYHALANAGSTEGFDEIKGDTSWLELKPILRAQIVSLKGDPAGALRMYERHLTPGAPVRLQANLLADKAWCHIELHQFGEAVICAELALASWTEEAQIDDQAATHSRLAQVFAALGDAVQYGQQRELAREAWGAHVEMQAKIVMLLARMDERGGDTAESDPRT